MPGEDRDDYALPEPAGFDFPALRPKPAGLGTGLGASITEAFFVPGAGIAPEPPRMRTGDYRMQFQVRAEEVMVEKVGHRDGFYDD